MLTSIGYGYVCPSTFEGRLFGVLYCLIGWLALVLGGILISSSSGIPLTLVNVAKYVKVATMLFQLSPMPYSVAKFLADFVFFLHYEFWKVWGRLRNIGHGRHSPGASAGGSSGDLFGDSDDEQVKSAQSVYQVHNRVSWTVCDLSVSHPSSPLHWSFSTAFWLLLSFSTITS